MVKLFSMKNLKYFTAVLLAVSLSSCLKTEFDDFEVSNGSANFSNYVSVGDSYTQGLQDGGLHNEHNQQDNSYPAIIAKQMSTSFVQPTVSGTGSGYMFLTYRNEKIVVVKPYDPDVLDNDAEALTYDPSYTNWADKTIKYNNLGVAGLNVRNVAARNSTESLEYHIYLGSSAPGVLSWNGVSGEPIVSYGRFLNFGTISNRIEYIQHVRNSNATFFTNWLGINDVLAWSKNGGDPNSGAYQQTNPAEFRQKYDSILDAFQQIGAKGVCANIHDVTQSPYFTTVTLEVLKKDIWIKEGADTTVIRKAVPEDLLLLSSSSLIAKGDGLTQANPLPHQQVLDKDEIVIARNHLQQLNNEIYASAAAHGYAMVDMYAFMDKLNKGMTYDGVALSVKYIEGGAYSLDGLHPNSRGNAMVANEFIRVINTTYGSTLRPVAIGNYSGIVFP